jgi:hypothetical protein
MMLSRRSFFRGLGAILAAPPVAKIASLIPPLATARVRSLNYLTASKVTREAVMMFAQSNEFLQSMNAQYLEEFGDNPVKIGSKLRISLPSDYRVS